MKIAILNSYYGETDFTNRYRLILDYNKIPYENLDIRDMKFLDKILDKTHVVFRYTHYDSDKQIADKILPILEKRYSIKCFPNSTTYFHCDDKIKQFIDFKSQNLPYAESYVFWNENDAVDFINNEAKLPLVFKLTIGAGSSNVMLVRSRKQAQKIIKQMFTNGVISGHLKGDTAIKHESLSKFAKKYIKKIIKRDSNLFWNVQKNYVLFQKYYPNNNYDLRITTIGERAFGFYREVRENDFRASGSGRINYEKEIDIKAVELALKISKDQGYQSMAYDFLYDENGEFKICDLAYSYQDIAVFKCKGYWDGDLNYHHGNYWPQYFQLIDLIDYTHLKQPDERHMNTF